MGHWQGERHGLTSQGLRTSSTASIAEVKKALEYEDKDDGAFWMLERPAVAIETHAFSMRNGFESQRLLSRFRQVVEGLHRELEQDRRRGSDSGHQHGAAARQGRLRLRAGLRLLPRLPGPLLKMMRWPTNLSQKMLQYIQYIYIYTLFIDGL